MAAMNRFGGAAGARIRGLAFLLLAALGPLAASPRVRSVPPLLFVSRAVDPAVAIPGFGPMERTARPGGRLMLRERNGDVHPFLAGADFFDVSDPAVSWDATTIAFAGVTSAQAPWRIYLCDAAGRNVRALTGAPPDSATGHFDDFDPAWLPDGRIVFASTRFPLVGERNQLPVSNLHLVKPDGTDLHRLSTDRNGMEEPGIDPRDGHVVAARWWFNRWKPSDSTEPLTTDPDRAVPADPVDLWHAISMRVDGEGMKLAGGWPRIRRETMAYQPSVMEDGTLIGVAADDPSLIEGVGAVHVVAYPGGLARQVPVAPGRESCAPALLADQRIVLSLRGASGDFDLALVGRPGDEPKMLVDLAGSHELDAVALVPRPRPPVPPALLLPPREEPVTDVGQLEDLIHTFRFDCLNVFANGPVDGAFPDAPRIQTGVRIRFFGTLSRPHEAGGDTVVMFRESPLTPTGAVHEHDMPADTPLFEELVDAQGRVLRTAHGPAIVPGFNSGRFGTGAKCMGCHAGHSALDVPKNYSSGTWTNAAPSAIVTTSGTENGVVGEKALTDRMTRGPLEQVSWIADRQDSAWVRLSWQNPIELNELVIYSPRVDRAGGTTCRIRQSELFLWRDGQPVHHELINKELSPDGTRVDTGIQTVTAVEIRLRRVDGRVLNRPLAALSEVEVIGRLTGS